jgi:antitoxin CcdA
MTKPHAFAGFQRVTGVGARAAKSSKEKAPAGPDPRSKRARQWLDENREALESSNDWVEKHGLPFAEFRLF